MITCPTCGAQNDPGNRFCDQCGTRLEAPAPAAPAVTAVAAVDQPTVTAATCPNCGATVVPGEAFCDNCGAALEPTTAVPSASTDAPTMLATPVVSSPVDAAATVACPSCGHMNLPGERFCENCGADLSATAPAIDDTAIQIEVAPVETTPAEAASPDAVSVEAPTTPTIDTSPNTSPVPEATPAVADATGDETVISVPSEPVAPPSEPAAVLPIEPAPAAAPAPTNDTERQRLEAEIARQDQIIAQFEQMQATFGAATPPAVVQGLADARVARDQAAADLAALAVPAVPAVDPAEIARLQEEIARQDQIIAQFEQMQATFGAATPPAVVQGLADARVARDQAATDLSALGGTAAAPAAVATAAPAAPSSPAASAEAAAPVPAPATPGTAPISPPAPAGPRLVIVEGGQVLKLPTDKAEITVGREDPVSSIFPEVDMTAFGGEAGGVSRQHARLTQSNGQWMIIDLNSTNYTRVDGTRLEPNVAMPLRDGMRIQFGRIAAIFHL